jgi:hypothetical protein
VTICANWAPVDFPHPQHSTTMTTQTAKMKMMNKREADRYAYAHGSSRDERHPYLVLNLGSSANKKTPDCDCLAPAADDDDDDNARLLMRTGRTLSLADDNSRDELYQSAKTPADGNGRSSAEKRSKSNHRHSITKPQHPIAKKRKSSPQPPFDGQVQVTDPATLAAELRYSERMARLEEALVSGEDIEHSTDHDEHDSNDEWCECSDCIDADFDDDSFVVGDDCING